MKMPRILALIVLFTGCAKRYESPGYGAEGYGAPASMDAEPTIAFGRDKPRETAASRRPSPAKGGPSRPSAPPPPMQAAPLEPPPPDVAEVVDEKAQRMVHYSGWAAIRSPRPRELVASVEKIAGEAGGHVESAAGDRVTVRVPAPKFTEVFAKIKALGPVLQQSVSADDVTEAFTAVELRLATLRTLRTRLQTLLAQAKSEQDKLALLAELQRVSEELDQRESQSRTLQGLADMSRITVEARRSERAIAARQDPSGFDWIRGLSPFARPFTEGRRLEVGTPEGLVVLSPKGPFVAESADGAVVWTLRRPNDPVGDGAFWAEAVKDRVSDEYAKAEIREVGAWRCVVLDEASEDPYQWRICLKSTAREVWVTQALFPSRDQVTRYGATVDAALSAGGS